MACSLLLGLLLAAAPADTLLVCPDSLLPAMQPWIQLREQQGRTVRVVKPAKSAKATRVAIRNSALDVQLKFIVLAGDADLPHGALQDAPRVPTHRLPARVNVRYGSAPLIASDLPYGDLDGDGVPEVAVGRLSADTPGELAVIVQKVIDYEHNIDLGPWRRQVNFVAGVGGLGPLADLVSESVVKYMLLADIPQAYSVSMTQANWRSPYCPRPSDVEAVTLSRLNEGCWFFVYIGHGWKHGLDELVSPGGRYRIFDAPSVKRLDFAHGAPIALLMACSAGEFDGPDDCLAERMLSAPGGPAAVWAGSRVTMPYGMAVLGKELLTECFIQQRPTLGELILAVQRQTLLRPRSDVSSVALDNVAALFTQDQADLEAERREHLQLFNLLGDPLLRLRHGLPVDLTVTRADDRLLVRGRCSVEGEALVELVVPRGTLRFDPPSRESIPDGGAELARTYAEANDSRLVAGVARAHRGAFQIELEVPPGDWQTCHVRAFVQGETDFALGSTAVDLGK